MDFTFFTTDNKSGHKTRETWFSKNYPEVYLQINDYINKLGIDMIFKEKIYFFYNNLTERPKCVTCKKELKFRNRFDNPYGEFCSLSCINNNKDEMKNRQTKTFIEKYGVNFYTQHPEFIIKQKKTKKEKYGDSNYNNVNKMMSTKKKKYGDEHFNNIEKQKITNVFRYGVENYSKSGHYINKVNEDYKKSYPNLNIVEVEKSFVTIKCDKCDSIYQINKQLVYERNKRGYDVCTECNPIGQNNRSGLENELEDFIKTLSLQYETSNRKVLNKEELDFYFPSKNVAIELNGVYWHNELFVNSNYHLNKTIKSNNNGVELIHIFEDEWLYKKEIVKSIIKNRFNLNKNIIYARQCEIREINSIESKKFLEDNHIQGNVNSKIRIGLFYKNTLVSLMTFSKGRIIMGGKQDEWELNRFCNLINHTVIGSADRLFKYFLKNYESKKIISYSDIRIFNGGMYGKLGFNNVSQSKPNYWYVINGIRQHRFNYTKSKLVREGYDKNKTEKEIMFERKIYRIYDCGNIRWEYIK